MLTKFILISSTHTNFLLNQFLLISFLNLNLQSLFPVLYVLASVFIGTLSKLPLFIPLNFKITIITLLLLFLLLSFFFNQTILPSTDFQGM